MWQLNSIHIKNIVSHLDSKYNFEKNKTIVIHGVNRDNRNRSNGSGKSGFMEGIDIAMFGCPTRKVGKKDIVSNGAKSGEVTLEMTNNFLNKSVRIWRQIHTNSKSAEYKMWINEVEKKDFTSENDFNKYILDLLDISDDDLKNYFFISKRKYKSFFSMGDTVQKEIISRFSNADIIDAAIPGIQVDITKHTNDIVALERKKTVLETKIQVMYDQILEEEQKDEKGEVINTLQTEKGKIEVQLTNMALQGKEMADQLEIAKTNLKAFDKEDKFADQIVDLEKREKEVTEQIASSREQLKSLSETLLKEERQEVEECLNQSTEELTSLKQGLKGIDEMISELEKGLRGIVQCPKCSHEFSLADENFNVDEARENLTSCETLAEEAKENINLVSEFIKELQGNKKAYESQIVEAELSIKKAINLLNQQLSVISRDREKITREINDLKRKKLNLEHQVSTLATQLANKRKDYTLNENRLKEIAAKIEEEKAREYKDKTVEIRAKVSKLEEELSELEPHILNLKGEIAKCEEWIFNFKKFKSFLANKSICSISGYCNYYLDKMKSNLQIQIEGYRLLADKKTLKESITTYVLRDGILDGNYEKYSGGERITLDFSLIITLQKLINLNSKSGGLDFIATDEIIESIDSVGVEDVINALNDLKVTSMHITHAPFNKEFENKVVIEKENGISKILAA